MHSRPGVSNADSHRQDPCQIFGLTDDYLNDSKLFKLGLFYVNGPLENILKIGNGSSPLGVMLEMATLKGGNNQPLATMAFSAAFSIMNWKSLTVNNNNKSLFGYKIYPLKSQTDKTMHKP